MPSASPSHVPVLLEEAIRALSPRPGDSYVDCTVGGAGHSRAILQAIGPSGRLLGLDADGSALERARRTLLDYSERVTLVHANFRDLAEIARSRGFDQVAGVLLDLGVSSIELDVADRGFSFRQDGPLDMRFDPDSGPTAADLVNDLGERELADVLFRYGEEPRARAISRSIVNARANGRIETTFQLADVVSRSVGRSRSMHPATRTFQALRIAVNDELGALTAVLPQALEVLRPGGRLVAISFHSLEDRIVKQFIARQVNPCICPPGLPVCACGRVPTLKALFRKAAVASEDELKRNPRARSARLRAATKL